MKYDSEEIQGMKERIIEIVRRIEDEKIIENLLNICEIWQSDQEILEKLGNVKFRIEII